MGAITGVNVYAGELAGEVKLLQLTAAIAATSDTITLTPAVHAGVASIVGIVGAVITGGMDAAFTAIQASFTGLVITVLSLNEAGVAATDFTGTTVSLTVLIKTTA